MSAGQVLNRVDDGLLEPFAHQPVVSVVTVVLNDPDGLLKTIRSVQRQTYSNIEHVVVDGGSEPETIDLIQDHRDEIDVVVWGPDSGIYDALNRGIGAATGTWIALLHAGDEYVADFVQNQVDAVTADSRKIGVGQVSQNGISQGEGSFDDGILLHHLGVNHNTFLAHRQVYESVGPFDLRFPIAADALWTRRARDLGYEFVSVPEAVLEFAPGGASSGKSAEAQREIVREHARTYRERWPYLSPRVAEAAYNYRFDESLVELLCVYVEWLNADLELRQEASELLRAMRSMLIHIWKQRRVVADRNATAAAQASLRLRLCESLDIQLSDSNVDTQSESLGQALRDIDALVGSKNRSKTTIHVVDRFSSTSERFVYESIKAQDSFQESQRHIVLCRQRVNSDVRPMERVVVLNFVDEPRLIIQGILNVLQERLQVTRLQLHFGTTAWRFLEAAPRSFREIPTIISFHGIDVFDLTKNSAYRDFLLHLTEKDSVQFAVVSSYLKRMMVEFGLPEKMIVIVPNTVAQPYVVKDRRLPTSDCSSAELTEYQILNVGRLVALKGHDDLIKAVSRLVFVHAMNVKLTIVYGHEDLRLSDLKSLANRRGVGDRVKFVDFVDFHRKADFYASFDLYVSSSTYSDEEIPRAETFNVSLVEAVMAGLPAVVTDVGGQVDSVLGASASVHVVPSDDFVELANGIAALLRKRVSPEDTLRISEELASQYSPKRHSEILKATFDYIDLPEGNPRIRLAVFAARLSGGAGNGTRLTLGALETVRNLDITVVVGEAPEEWTGSSLRVVDLSPVMNRQPVEHNFTMFSEDPVGLSEGEIDEIISSNDAFSIHWVAGMLSVANIARLIASGKPVLLTFRDMNLLSGGCHYFHGCDRWMTDCKPCPQAVPATSENPHRTLHAKLDLWQGMNVVPIALSKNSGEIAAKSRLFSHRDIRIIPNPVDTSVFCLGSRVAAREKLGIPRDARVVLLAPSFLSSVKGVSEALLALSRAGTQMPNTDLILMANNKVKVDSPPAHFVLHRLPWEGGRQEFAQILQAADVVLVPSTEETFSNTVVEALACGTSVCGFAVGVLAELAEDFANARAVTIGDVSALGDALVAALSDDGQPDAYMAKEIGKRFSFAGVGKEYVQAIEGAQDEILLHGKSSAPWSPLSELKRSQLAELLVMQKKPPLGGPSVKPSRMRSSSTPQERRKKTKSDPAQAHGAVSSDKQASSSGLAEKVSGQRAVASIPIDSAGAPINSTVASRRVSEWWCQPRRWAVLRSRRRSSISVQPYPQEVHGLATGFVDGTFLDLNGISVVRGWIRIEGRMHIRISPVDTRDVTGLMWKWVFREDVMHVTGDFASAVGGFEIALRGFRSDSFIVTAESNSRGSQLLIPHVGGEPLAASRAL